MLLFLSVAHGIDMIKIRQIIGLVAALFLAAVAIIITVTEPSCATSDAGQDNPSVTTNVVNQTTPAATNDSQPDQILRTCPQVSELERDGLYWVSHDKNWKCFSESTAKKIDKFIGAQWVGLKVGKIICLYQTEEFTVAMEQVHSDLALEPNTNNTRVGNWSSLIKNSSDMHLCQSVNVADCAFYIKMPPTITDIYKQIQYTGGTKDDEN